MYSEHLNKEHIAVATQHHDDAVKFHAGIFVPVMLIRKDGEEDIVNSDNPINHILTTMSEKYQKTIYLQSLLIQTVGTEEYRNISDFIIEIFAQMRSPNNYKFLENIFITDYILHSDKFASYGEEVPNDVFSNDMIRQMTQDEYEFYDHIADYVMMSIPSLHKFCSSENVWVIQINHDIHNAIHSLIGVCRSFYYMTRYAHSLSIEKTLYPTHSEIKVKGMAGKAYEEIHTTTVIRSQDLINTQINDIKTHLSSTYSGSSDEKTREENRIRLVDAFNDKFKDIEFSHTHDKNEAFRQYIVDTTFSYFDEKYELFNRDLVKGILTIFFSSRFHMRNAFEWTEEERTHTNTAVSGTDDATPVKDKSAEEILLAAAKATDAVGESISEDDNQINSVEVDDASQPKTINGDDLPIADPSDLPVHYNAEKG